MKTVKKVAAQGDMIIIRVEKFDSIGKKVERQKGKLIVTHSETGHHHVIERQGVDMFDDKTDPLVAWLEVHGEEALPNVADLIHERNFDTHEPIGLPVGKYKIQRQEEYTPQGWRQVVD